MDEVPISFILGHDVSCKLLARLTSAEKDMKKHTKKERYLYQATQTLPGCPNNCTIYYLQRTHPAAMPPKQCKMQNPSSNWWSRLIESRQSGAPVNRRSHSATVYRTAASSDDDTAVVKEYMIVSGGFTDQDWQTFPVWAYDMTDAKSVDEDEDDGSNSEFSDNVDDDSSQDTTATNK